jgi:hypothetical protein
VDKQHRLRVMKELKYAGMSAYGLMKMASLYLPKIIHKNETIHGVVYGRGADKIGSVMLVATDKRILFLDKKPL